MTDTARTSAPPGLGHRATRAGSRWRVGLVLPLTAALLLTACAGSDGDDPATAAAAQGGDPADTALQLIENCGTSLTVGDPPERVVTVNQAATETMLALGLEDRLVGTAYLDDEIPDVWADAYASVPVLADQYPSQETLLDTEPDFVYGSYPSAFQPDSSGDRDELAGFGIGTYVSPAACPDKPGDEPLSIETVWQEILEIGEVFGVSDAAEALVEEERERLAEAVDNATDLSETTVMWWDGGTDTPSIGACCGAPGMIMDAAGVQNAFDDVDGNWSGVSWEQVTEREPDVIVLIDADFSLADEKRDHIASIPAVQDLPAVRDGRFVVVPFTSTTPGVRNVDALVDLIDELTELA